MNLWKKFSLNRIFNSLVVLLIAHFIKKGYCQNLFMGIITAKHGLKWAFLVNYFFNDNVILYLVEFFTVVVIFFTLILSYIWLEFCCSLFLDIVTIIEDMLWIFFFGNLENVTEVLLYVCFSEKTNVVFLTLTETILYYCFSNETGVVRFFNLKQEMLAFVYYTVYLIPCIPASACLFVFLI